ncbi:magnesium transporter CorA family protein [Paenibacillus arenilitoris]|uniref:Magnesium transporter CorA family protein n=1 Tax=Paenibacillus arenilitoris TaxID=2772299 RepID=A0A927H943_9BACL|nr:magnesium transporter CorA family protein [Paenibacillus arenilitoris]MBD2872358.1 magnesium transporter CorA family protein [Paenibacillus arenilitoris]
MIHRMLRYPSEWEWHVLQLEERQAVRQEALPSRKASRKPAASPRGEQKAVSAAERLELEAAREQADEMKKAFPACASWIDECAGRRTNQISIGDNPAEGRLLYGTLMFQLSESQSDVQPFHFWVSQKRLLTMHDDIRLPLRLQSGEHEAKLAGCGTAPEALFVMLGIVLETFHEGLDGFETRLGELEASMRQANKTVLIDVIFERRYDLLHWSHLFIPVRELHGAAKEAFMEELTETESFKRITHKLERIDALLKHYALEIDTLISMDDAISSFRGNDIMKTLTIFTVLFLPATIGGTIWGTNFNHLPWKDVKWGFAGMITSIAIVTSVIYAWLWKKGWTGDLLHGRRPSEIASEGPPSRARRAGGKRRAERTAPLAAKPEAADGDKPLPSRKRR